MLKAIRDREMEKPVKSGYVIQLREPLPHFFQNEEQAASPAVGIQDGKNVDVSGPNPTRVFAK